MGGIKLIKIYDALPDEAAMIRRAVFMEEQGFKQEFDDVDNISKHLVLFKGSDPAAACRLYKKNDSNDFIVGRIAVLKHYRGKGLGAEILRSAEQAARDMKGEKICLHAQMRAKQFYEKQGYLPYGEVSFEEDCPHIWMCKGL